MKKLSEEEKNAFVERYKNYYFRTDPVDVDEKKKVLGDISLTGTEDGVEDYFFPGGKYRKFDQIGVKHILWKAGRLTPEMLDMPDEDLTPRNGQGREIENLDEFLRWINEINKGRLQKCLDDEDYKEAIKVLFECKLGSGLKQIGSVYVITILFFLSEGKYPIYDKYAHTAVKALYLNKNPKAHISIQPFSSKSMSSL